MRKLFTLCLLIVSLTVTAQWQQTGSKVRYVNGLGIPTKDTAAGVAADSSQILIRPADSSLYIKYKRTWVKVGSGGTIGGSGTTNRVSKFTGATTLGNSSIVDSASAVAMTINPSGNIGIGITNPSVRFHVLVPGNEMRIESNTSSDGFIRYINTSGSMSFGMSGAPTNTMLLYDRTNNHNAYEYLGGASGRHVWYTANAERMRITSGGNALLGTTTDNGTDRLQVSGSILSTSTVKAGANGVNGLVVNSGGATGAILNNTATSGGAGFDQIRLTFQHLGADRAYWYYSNTGGQLVTSTALTTNDIVFAPGNSNAFYMKAGTQNVVISNSGTDNSVDKLQVNGSIQGTGFNQAYTSKTTTYTATTSDYFIDCTSGTFTVNLFTAVGNTGRILIIKNSGTGTITVDPNGTQTIDGATTQTLSTQWSRVHIISDGANWKIISN